jgi:glycosyltransferase involved in cell wall biosynthesis
MILTMILKDEAHTIAKTLLSVKPYISSWYILDTGSADGTEDVILKTLGDVPGTLGSHPFENFSKSRNRALALIPPDKTDWIFYCDADDVLEGGDKIAPFLAGIDPSTAPDQEAFAVRVTVPSGIFDSTRIFHSSAPWHFEGPVHEVLVRKTGAIPTSRIPGVFLHHRDTAPEGRGRERWKKDVELLKEELNQNPASSRSAFYLALTYYWLSDMQNAIAALDRRIAMGGWHEEIFFSLLTKGRALSSLGPLGKEAARDCFLKAHSLCPHRAEPLFDLASLYAGETEDHALVVLFARRAMELPLPSRDVLFLDEDVYQWKAADLVGTHAYYLGEMALGQSAAAVALKNGPPEEARLLSNLRFYLKDP